MSGSDDDCYENLGESFSPPKRNFQLKPRSMTHSGMGGTQSNSHLPQDIDKRPPYPIPKAGGRVIIGDTPTNLLNYDRITVSPVAPDYELSSASPPRNGYNILSTSPPCNGHKGPSTSPPRNGHNGPSASPPHSGLHVSSMSPPQTSYGLPFSNDNRPPLPPINPKRKPPTRSQSESSDQLSQTPPRSVTMTLPRQISNPSVTGYTKHSRSNSDGGTSPSHLHNTIDSISNAGYYKSSAEMPLRVFSARHREDLPVQVVVTKGYYGPDERTSISDGDMFNIHFFKQAKIVKVQDSNKYEYTVPLNSSLEFGLIYSLPSGFKQVDLKYHFKTINDVLQLKELPKALRVTKAHRGSGPESSVEKNDLLLVKEMKMKKRGLKSTKVLRCVVAGTGIKKMLNEDCAGYFSVKPIDTKLFLPEIVEHIVLPQRANIYPSMNTRIDLPQHLMQDDIEILRVEIEESIVATTILDKEESNKPVNAYQNTVSSPLVDIPQDLDIEVAIIKLGDGETNQLYAETRTLCEKYNPSEVSYLNLPSSVTASAQTTLFRSIRQDHNRQVGVEILRPLNAYRSPETATNRLSNDSDSSRKQLCTPSECANAEEVNGRLESLEMHATSIDDRLNKFELLIQTVGNSSGKEQKEKLSVLQDEVTKTRKETEELRKIITDIPDLLAKLSTTVDTVMRNVELLQADSIITQKENRNVSNTNGVIMNGSSHKNNGIMSTDFEAQNREYLHRLNDIQVAKLLSSMKMSQYVEAFKSEQITGEILSELNEQVLQEELGITSKIHRIKLMKVIAGRHSAMSLLNGDDPYYVHLSQKN